MGSRQVFRLGRRVNSLTAALQRATAASSSGPVSVAVANCSRGFATDAYNITKEHNSHWLGYSLGGVTAVGLTYYLFTHQTELEAKADLTELSQYSMYFE